MADLLGTGLSALTAMQRALSTTSHNISNANTEGYTRQRVDFATRAPTITGSGYIGSGVNAVEVNRIYDGFVNTRVTTSTSSYHREDAYLNLAMQVDDLLADSEAGLSIGLQSFFDSIQQLANDPTSTANRQVMLTEAENLTDRFHYLDDRLGDLRASVNSQMRSLVSEVNSLAEGIAELNTQIVDGYASGSGHAPNDLLDQRDQLVNQLAELVKVNTVQQDDGALNVFIGTGQTLVLGANTTALSVQPTGPDLDQLEIVYTSSSGSVVPVTDLITGGTLGGVLAFRDEVLDPTQNALGRVAVGLVDAFNALHNQGMDLDGNLGGDFFTDLQPQVYPDPANASTLAVDYTNVSELTTDDYELSYDGSAWSLRRSGDQQLVSMTGSGTAADPFQAEGLEFVVSGAPAAGDYYLVRPTRLAGAQIGVEVDNVREIAAASPVVAQAGTANAGNAEVAGPTVIDATDPNLMNTVDIVFDNPPTSYTVNGGPSIAYTSGADIDVNGWRIQISGTPQAGDGFTVGANAGGVGDNRNALAMGNLQSSLVLEAGGAGNPTASIAGAYEQLVAEVGTKTRAAENNATAQATLLEQAQAQRESVSGVNLDEEAANLLRYQQAYQAAAQVISVADEMFQTLLNAVRR